MCSGKYVLSKYILNLIIAYDILDGELDILKEDIVKLMIEKNIS